MCMQVPVQRSSNDDEFSDDESDGEGEPVDANDDDPVDLVNKLSALSTATALQDGDEGPDPGSGGLQDIHQQAEEGSEGEEEELLGGRSSARKAARRGATGGVVQRSAPARSNAIYIEQQLASGEWVRHESLSAAARAVGKGSNKGTDIGKAAANNVDLYGFFWRLVE
jgi:hypothetical protein